MIITACGKFKYNQIIKNYELCNLAQEAHKFNCKANEWNYNSLIPGAFGYDNLIVSIGFALENCSQNPTIEELSNLIHEGWIINYIYWRDNKPYIDSEFYRKPYTDLGDEIRNKNAITKFEQLDETEKEKDRIIARFLLGKINFN